MLDGPFIWAISWLIWIIRSNSVKEKLYSINLPPNMGKNLTSHTLAATLSGDLVNYRVYASKWYITENVICSALGKKSWPPAALLYGELRTLLTRVFLARYQKLNVIYHIYPTPIHVITLQYYSLYVKHILSQNS